MTHHPGPCFQFHDPGDDVSEARHPTPGQVQAMELLELNPAHGAAPVRLSLNTWRMVDRIAAALQTGPADQ